MARPRMNFARRHQHTELTSMAGSTGYQIYATYRRTSTGAYIGDLKVVRVRDDRLIFPFDGAPEIGPFEEASSARDAAREMGEQLIAADRNNPE